MKNNKEKFDRFIEEYKAGKIVSAYRFGKENEVENSTVCYWMRRVKSGNLEPLDDSDISKRFNKGCATQEDTLKSIDWAYIQKEYDEKLLTWRDLETGLKINHNILKLAVAKGLFKSEQSGPRMAKRIAAGIIKARPKSEEEKKNLSVKRKQFLKDNPEKHPWRRKDKFKSVPCENLKSFLRENGIEFTEEFPEDAGGRFFSIDIAILHKKIAVEVNGFQHYERTGELKPYYQEREDYLKNLGWKVFQIPYTLCFKDENMAKIKASIDTETELFCVDKEWLAAKLTKKTKKAKKEPKPALPLDPLEKIKKPSKKRVAAGVQLDFLHKFNCDDRYADEPYLRYQGVRATNITKPKEISAGLPRKVIDRPSKEELKSLIEQLGYTGIGRLYGVTDNSVSKWAKTYGINIRFNKSPYSGERIPKDVLLKRIQVESIKSIAKSIGAGEDLVILWTKDYGISKEDIKNFQLDRYFLSFPPKEQLEKDFLSDDLTLTEIAAKYGKQREGIKAYCKRFGIMGIEKFLRKK